jgi:hypothetical protein
VIVAADAWTIIPVIVGVLAAAGGVITWFMNGVRTERARLQKLYADAYSAVVSYQEYPYIIKRRRAPTADHPEIAGEERLRISGGLHGVQEQLNCYLAQISTESDAVSQKYTELVRSTRQVAGTYMHKAWEEPALDNDAGMNLHLNYSALRGPQDEYLTAVKKDMKFWRIAWVGLRKPHRIRRWRLTASTPVSSAEVAPPAVDTAPTPPALTTGSEPPK